MTAAVLADDFIDLLSKSGLLSDDEIASVQYRLRLGHCETAKEVGKILVRNRVLTHFQAEHLLQGRWRGLVLNEYKLLGVLGAGGMGWVYSAQELNSQWKVAIKVLGKERRDNKGMLARMQLEAQAGMRLSHPNILRTMELNQTEDAYGQMYYLVMELVKGITPLELYSINKKIDWRHACDIIGQAAKGLQYAHDQGLVHRDVKPENLLVRKEGTVKILDFGLAMMDENDEEFTMAMIFGQDRVGTADYVSPEQTVDSYTVDQRADIYSLGCAFYFMLTGSVPFPVSSTGKKVACHRRKRPKDIRSINPDVPLEVAEIVKKMTAKRPDRRFPKASFVEEAVAPFAERQEIQFDFAAVLRARIRQAEQHWKLKRKRPSSDAISRVASSIAGEAAEAKIDTGLRDDTQLDEQAKKSPHRSLGTDRK